MWAMARLEAVPIKGPFGDHGNVTILRALVLAITLAGTLLGTATAATAAPVLTAAPAAAAKKVPCSKAVRACVRLSTNQAWLLSDGKVVAGPVPISHGRKGFATPAGTFRVSFKNEDHVSSIYDQAMPYSVFFNGGIAFHQGSVRRSRTAASTCPGLRAGVLRRTEPGDRVQVVA